MYMQERFEAGQSVPGELAIIVGQGHHEQPGGPKLRHAVVQLLQHLHMELDEVRLLRDCERLQPPIICLSLMHFLVLATNVLSGLSGKISYFLAAQSNCNSFVHIALF